MNAIIKFTKQLFANHFINGKSLANNLTDTFKFNGGVHPPAHKAESTTRPIGKLAIPEKLTLPLRQHVGNLPKIKVQVGDHVLKGQILAEAEGATSAAIHAPTSGTIAAVSEQVIPHPSGLPDMCITLRPDGQDTWAKLQAIDWRNTPKKDLMTSLCASGIVDLGDATFPTHIKMRADGTYGVHTLVINAAECEPYISCDEMLMRERADEIVKGIEIAQYLLGAEKCMMGLAVNNSEVAKGMIAACANKNIQVKVIHNVYPSGDARRLVHLLLGTKIASGTRTTDVGLQVLNVGTILAIYRYFEFGEPSISRVVTMTGSVKSPQNFEVLFGTPLQSLVAAAGGVKQESTHFIMGGSMMGFDLPNADVPIIKATNCIIAAAPQLFAAPPLAMPCIRCARCADACPVNLQPQELYWFAKSDNFEKARDYKLFDCIECGSCSYVCPSNIPLVQYYRYAKSENIALYKAKESADKARERNDFRLTRIERETLERAKKYSERAQTVKPEANKSVLEAVDVTSAVATKVEFSASTNQTVAMGVANGISAKQAAIAAAIERAKTQKLAAAQAGITSKNIEK